MLVRSRTLISAYVGFRFWYVWYSFGSVLYSQEIYGVVRGFWLCIVKTEWLQSTLIRHWLQRKCGNLYTLCWEQLRYCTALNTRTGWGQFVCNVTYREQSNLGRLDLCYVFCPISYLRQAWHQRDFTTTTNKEASWKRNAKTHRDHARKGRI